MVYPEPIGTDAQSIIYIILFIEIYYSLILRVQHTVIRRLLKLLSKWYAYKRDNEGISVS